MKGGASLAGRHAARRESADKSPHSRRRLAARRAEEARAALANCVFCEHRCGVDRLARVAGVCHAGAEARIFSAQTEVSDELEIVPTFAIALSGCDLRCDFCITGRESWNARAGEVLEVSRIGELVEGALARGARTVMILGGEPTVFLPSALEVAAAVPDSARLVWKTNGHGSAEARALLDGIFDVWVVDYKFGNDECARRLARVEDYGEAVRANLWWASKRTDLIIRHLLMPGHIDCCWVPVASWIAENLPGTKVSLRAGFWPAWQARRHLELRRSCFPEEAKRAEEIGRELCLNMVL